MLLKAVSEALGIDSSEVLSLYFGELDDIRRGCLIGEAMDRRRTAEEGKEWLVEEAQKRALVDESVHRR
jgi:hypothetical protein